MDNYSLLLNKIRKDSMEMFNLSSTNPEDIKNQYISVDNIYDLFYHLFDTNSLLERNDSILENDKYNKFVFTEEYPNSFNTSNNIVTFELTKRAPASLGKDHPPFSGTKQYKPRYVRESKDINNNDTTIHYSHLYDNEITMTCWASTSRNARLTAMLVENIMSAAYFFLRRTVDVFVMNGRHEPIFTTKYENKKLVGIPISFFVRTNEVKTVKRETLEQLPEILLQGFRIDAQLGT